MLAKFVFKAILNIGKVPYHHRMDNTLPIWKITIAIDPEMETCIYESIALTMVFLPALEGVKLYALESE